MFYCVYGQMSEIKNYYYYYYYNDDLILCNPEPSILIDDLCVD